MKMTIQAKSCTCMHSGKAAFTICVQESGHTLYTVHSPSQVHSYCPSHLRKEDRAVDHHHQYSGVAGQLPPLRPRHDVRQGCEQAAFGGVYDVPGRA